MYNKFNKFTRENNFGHYVDPWKACSDKYQALSEEQADTITALETRIQEFEAGTQTTHIPNYGLVALIDGRWKSFQFGADLDERERQSKLHTKKGHPIKRLFNLMLVSAETTAA